MFQVLVFLGLGSVAWYLLIVLPQKKQHGTHERTLGQLGVGSNVMTVGGIFGRVQSIEGDTIVLEIAPGMVTRVASDGIARIVAGGEIALPTPASNQHHAASPAPVSAPAPAPQNEALQMHQHSPDEWQQPQQPAFGHPQQPTIHAQFMGQPQQLQAPQYSVAPQPTFALQQPQHHVVQAAPTHIGQHPGEHVMLRAAADSVGYVPRQFTAFELPPPPVFGHTPQPQSQPQPYYQPQAQYQPQAHVQHAAPQQYAPAQPQLVQPHFAHQPVQLGVPMAMPQPAPQQYHPQQVVQQVQTFGLPMYQGEVQPQQVVAAPQHGAPAMHQGANPDTYDSSARVHSNAPAGMGANLRLDDPSLTDIVDRARRERAELADEYRRLNDPMVTIDQVQPHVHQHVQQHVMMQQQPHAIQPHAVEHQHGPSQLFVQPHAQIPPPVAAHQFPMPAIPPSVDAYARPNIAQSHGEMPAPSAAAFYRVAPYAPQHEAAATPA